ncbi:MAG TPA: FAD-dependent oxidoreductase [Bacteroidales bacterium]|nr:FAD-dependent oxidoreductase [Bacteroidales bacterium]HPT11443.1 FAD-dependent oxidoreductase [Bacteroidales bacterium]
MTKHVVIAGGGVAGIEAAGALADLGQTVTIIEKETAAGGHVKRWHALFPDRRPAEEVKKYLSHRLKNKNITVINNTSVNRIRHHGHSLTVETSAGDNINADAVIVATGFDLFDAARKEEYGYGIYNNVITAPELEDMFNNDALVTRDGRKPSRIGFVHCVGSRDEKVCNHYCSKVCCVTAVKQAIEVREKLPDCEVFCFYMDMRMFGPYYEELYREAQEVHNINFIRGKVSEASNTINGRIAVKVEDTLAGRPLKMELDVLVLMTGMEMSRSGARLAETSGLTTGKNRFLSVTDNHIHSNRSNMHGVFYAGACTAPMNITDTISHARAAVMETVNYLSKL